MFRRKLIEGSGLIAATTGLIPRLACAQSTADRTQATETINLARDWGFKAPEPSATTSNVTGSGAARPQEVAKAFRLLYNAPRDKEPIEVGQYFEGLKYTEEPVKPEGYFWNEQWPSQRPNPVIVGFWSMINVLPDKGDETPWCAAFVNFCLACAGRSINWSPSALKFLDYGTETKNPQPGNIVCFSRPGGGHVGFYVGPAKDAQGKIAGTRVLGGNQSGGSPGSQGIVNTGTIWYNSDHQVEGYRVIPPRAP